MVDDAKWQVLRLLADTQVEEGYLNHWDKELND